MNSSSYLLASAAATPALSLAPPPPPPSSSTLSAHPLHSSSAVPPSHSAGRWSPPSSRCLPAASRSPPPGSLRKMFFLETLFLINTAPPSAPPSKVAPSTSLLGPASSVLSARILSWAFPALLFPSSTAAVLLEVQKLRPESLHQSSLRREHLVNNQQPTTNNLTNPSQEKFFY